MKKNWKAMAASLVLVVGLSGAAFGADRNHDADRGRNNVRVEHRDGDRFRDNRGWNRDRGDHGRYWNRDHDRRVYDNNPYYGSNGYYNGYYYGNPYRR